MPAYRSAHTDWFFSRVWLVLVWLSVAGGFPRLADAQNLQDEFLVRSWETDDGLPENSANAIVQDEDGYLWIATFNGLVRFDGTNFTVYDRSNRPELPSSSIVNLHISRDGRLWISAQDAMVVKDGDSWTRLDASYGWVGDFARTIAEAADGTLWVTTFDGHVMRFTNDRFEELPPHGGNNGNGCGGYVDANGDFWLVQNEFFGRWTPQGWIEHENIYSFDSEGDFGWGPSRGGGVWIIRDGRTKRVENGRVVSEFEEPPGFRNFWRLFEAADGTLWVCSFTDGIHRRKRSGEWEHISRERGLTYHGVRCVVEDRDGNTWIGTSGGGMMMLRPRRIRHFGEEQGLKEPVVKTVAPMRDGTALAGTYGQGIFRIDPLAGRVESASAFVDAAVRPFILSLVKDSEERVWIGTDGQGVLELAGGIAEPAGGIVFDDREFNVVFEDSGGRVWAGSKKALWRMDGGAWQRLEDPEAPVYVRCMVEDSRGRLLLGSQANGITVFESGRFEIPATSVTLKREGVSCLFIDRNETLWVGTVDHGLFRALGADLLRLEKIAGLPTNRFSSILEDDEGFLWFGTNRGILRAGRDYLTNLPSDEAMVSYRHYDRSDGLLSVECPVGYQPTAAKDEQGRLWFATLKGVVMVEPSEIPPDASETRPVFEGISYIDGGGEQQIKKISFGSLELPPDNVRVRLGFAAPSLSAPQKTRFRYRMDGPLVQIDELTRNGEVTFHHLDPGGYEFRLWAAGSGGSWNVEPVMFSFSVAPYYWQTLWFRLVTWGGLFVLGGAGVWSVYRARWRAERRRFARERAVAEERARFAQVLENTSDLVAFASADGDLTFLNGAGRELLGTTDDESGQLFPKAALEEAENNGTWRGELEVTTDNGAGVPVSGVLQCHRSSDGGVTFFSAVMRDISREKQEQAELLDFNSRLEMTVQERTEELTHSNAQLKAVNEELEAFCYSVSHDLRAPLRHVDGFARALEEDCGDAVGDEGRRLIDRISAGSNRMGELIDALLDLSRVTRRTFERKRFDISVLACEVRDEVDQGRATWEIEQGLEVEADRALVRIALTNFFENALKYTGPTEEPQIAFGKICHEGVDCFYVKDNGVGFDMEFANTLFKPFRRLHTGTEFEGTGIGLATVHRIVGRHEGRVWASAKMDEGATFYFTL